MLALPEFLCDNQKDKKLENLILESGCKSHVSNSTENFFSFREGRGFVRNGKYKLEILFDKAW